MDASPDPPAAADTFGAPLHRDYFAERRARVDDFVLRQFAWPGTFRLHGAALGLDIVRAPLNVMLSPVLVLTRIAGYLCRRTGWRGVGTWLGNRRILLRSDVARRVETCIVTDLLDLPLDPGAAARDPDALSRAVLAAPRIREIIGTRSPVAAPGTVGQRVAGALGEYAGTRSAVAEMTTTLCVLIVGALTFRALTPGMLSMTPGVAEALARTAAIANFPLGPRLGGLWYAVVDVDPSPALVAATVAVLIAIGSVVAAFAGVLADPVQVRLGIHRRRLLRLLDTLEVELTGAGDRPFVAREHFAARLLDVSDALASAVRMFRG